MSIYYTYLIGWSNHNKWYYGVRYSKHSHTNELWSTYFTSSKHVSDFRKNYGEPDIVEIRKTFTDSYSARLWENKVLLRMDVVRDDKWLNKTNNISIDVDAALKGSKKPKSQSFKDKCRTNRTGKKHSEETKEKMRQKALGRPGYWKGKSLSDNTKQKLSSIGKSRVGPENPFYGKKHSEESKRKIGDSKSSKS